LGFVSPTARPIRVGTGPHFTMDRRVHPCQLSNTIGNVANLAGSRFLSRMGPGTSTKFSATAGRDPNDFPGRSQRGCIIYPLAPGKTTIDKDHDFREQTLDVGRGRCLRKRSDILEDAQTPAENLQASVDIVMAQVTSSAFPSLQYRPSEFERPWGSMVVMGGMRDGFVDVSESPGPPLPVTGRSARRLPLPCSRGDGPRWEPQVGVLLGLGCFD